MLNKTKIVISKTASQIYFKQIQLIIYFEQIMNAAANKQ